LLKKIAAILQQDYMREMRRKQEREGRNFGIKELLGDLIYQSEERGLPFKGGKEERPLLDELQVSPIQKRRIQSKGVHF
jgi:hypothetical protein